MERLGDGMVRRDRATRRALPPVPEAAEAAVTTLPALEARLRLVREVRLRLVPREQSLQTG